MFCNIAYGSAQLAEQMNIKKIKNKVLNPIMDKIISGWERKLLDIPSDYEISDIVNYKKDLDDPYADEELCYHCGEQLITPASGKGYCLVVDGKIVIMDIHKGKTHITNDEAWWLKSAVEFAKDENGSRKMHERMKGFVAKQNIRKIAEEFITNFEGKGTEKVNIDMKNFYLKGDYLSYF